MPISKSGGAVRVDKSACIPFGTPSGSISLTTAYQTLRSISGKGFLDTALLQGGAAVYTLRITVDGIVTFEGTSNSNTNVTGFTKRSLLLTNAGNMVTVNPANPSLNQNITGGGAIVGYPYTANVAQAQTLSIAADSIYFFASLLIEAKSGASNSASYCISGGYQ